MRPLLGTFVEVGIPASSPPTQANAIFDAVFENLALIDSLLSIHRRHSELNRINCAPEQWHCVHRHTLNVLRLAHALQRQSEGLFNVGCGQALLALGKIHDIGYPNIAPFSQPLSNSPFSVCARQVKVAKGVILCTDGIAKGYAVDVAIAIIRRAGLASGYINAGGDLAVFGEQHLPVWLQDHLGLRHYVGQLQNAAIATSVGHGTSRHPAQLIAANGATVAVGTFSVIANKAWRADALTKVAAQGVAATRLAALGGRVVTVPNT